MALEIIRIDTAGMTPEQLYNAMDQKLANLVQQLNMKLLFFNDQDTNIIETRKTILTIEQAQSEFEQVITNNIAAIDGNIYKIHGELADYKKVVAGELTAVDGYIATLRGEFADYKVIVAEDFTASTGRIDKLSGDLAEYKVIVAGDISAANGRIDTISGDLADYKKVVAGSIEAITGNFEDLKTNALTAEKADLLYASIGSFDAVSGRVGILEGDFLSFKNGDFDSLSANVANIQTLIFGSASGTVISSDFSNTVVAHIGDAQIQSAMIKELAFDKIAGVDINTTNLKIHSEDGRSQWFDNTIQISDANRTRVQIGKDGTGDYSLSAWDTNGNLMFDARGIKAEAIKDSIIRNDMVATDANISGSKLDINSVYKEINGSTETIKSNRIFLDEKKQTLDVAFLAMSEQVTEQGTELTSYGTQLSTIQGQISSKIWKQDITTAVDAAQTAMNTKYSNLEQSLNGFKISVGETYSTKTEASKVLEAANQAILASQANAEDLTSFIKSTNSELEDLQGQIDGSIMTWFYDYVPTSSNIPAKDWTSAELKNNHLGDLFYDTITGYCYRWQVLNNAYSWQRITDVDVTKALSDAAKAKDTADSKRRVFVTTPTPPYEIGDLWTQGTEGELMRCKVTKSESQSYSAADWAKATKYTDDTTANQAIRGIETTNSKISEITTDVDNITARVLTTETNLTEVNGSITDLSNRVSAAELSITKDAIISAVSDTYATKNALATVDGKFANYSTTTQMNSAIEQKANSITSTVSSTYATKAESNAVKTVAEAANAYVNNAKNNYGYQYKHDIIIYGESDKYYPVVLRGGNQDVMREILVNRSYNDQAPTDWNGHPTAKGISLAVKIKGNFGGWGGTNYQWWIHDLNEMYGYVFAGAVHCMSNMGFAIFLRGGGETGAKYHLYSDQPLAATQMNGTSPQICYNSDQIGNSGTTYVWNAPAPRTLTEELKEEIKRKIYIDVASDASNRVTNAESQITQQAKEISLRVKETDITGNYIVGKINLTSTTAAIEAQHVAITGDITMKTWAGEIEEDISGVSYEAESLNDVLFGNENEEGLGLIDRVSETNKNIADLQTGLEMLQTDTTKESGIIVEAINNMKAQVDANDKRIADLNEYTSAINQYTQDIKAYVRVVQSGLLIGQSEKNFNTLITPKSMNFREGDNTVAYVSNDAFNLKRGVVESLRIGNYVLQPEDNGTFNIDYVPV